MNDVLSIYKGTNVEQLPTPSFIIKEDKFDENCKLMLENVQELAKVTNSDIRFRPHVKTHKTAKGTFKQLGHGFLDTPFNSILVSTIKEAEGLLNYQNSIHKTYIKDITFSLPACIPEILDQLQDIHKRVDHLRIFVDNPEHIDNLGNFGKPNHNTKWSVFLKIDMGTTRAGVVPQSNTFSEIINKFKDPKVLECVELFGIYAHAGHSYGSNNILEAHQTLLKEIQAVNQTAKDIQELLPALDASKLLLSVGATPTSNSLRIRDEPQIIDYIKNKLVGILEIHCGNYCLYDLQQVSTGCVAKEEVSGFVLGSVVSSYKERNEILTNTGVMALTRESSRIKGFGLCVSLNEISSNVGYHIKWCVDRISQEHGILKPLPEEEEEEDSNTQLLPIGSKLAIIPQHACICMGQFPYYFVLDADNKVTDVWYPFQKW